MLYMTASLVATNVVSDDIAFLRPRVPARQGLSCQYLTIETLPVPQNCFLMLMNDTRSIATLQ